MKILFLSYVFPPSTGGIESISRVLAWQFQEQGHEIHVLTESESKADETEFPFTVLRKPGIAVLIKEFLWADVVFENNPSMRLGWPRIFFKKPSVLVFHTWVYGQHKIDRSTKIKLWYCNSATKKIVVSKVFSAHLPFATDVVNNFIDEEVFHPYQGVAKDHDFAFLGRLVPDKGPALAIKAFAAFTKSSAVKSDRIFTLSIIGEGSERKTLENLAASLGIADRVVFYGKVTGKELGFLLNRHKYLLVPSFWDEPFGLVALEGMACECIPIVAKSGGLPEAVGAAGLIFEKGNVDSLAECMRVLSNDRDLEKQLRAAATGQLSKFSTSVAVDKYLNHIHEAIKKSA